MDLSPGAVPSSLPRPQLFTSCQTLCLTIKTTLSTPPSVGPPTRPHLHNNGSCNAKSTVRSKLMPLPQTPKRKANVWNLVLASRTASSTTGFYSVIVECHVGQLGDSASHAEGSSQCRGPALVNAAVPYQVLLRFDDATRRRHTCDLPRSDDWKQ